MKRPKLAKYSDCTGCGTCVAICQKKAIAIDYDKNGFLIPEIDTSLCIECGACEKSCPILHPENTILHSAKNIRTYTAWSKDDTVCMNATSGGVFAQLAIDLLNSNPESIVCGAELLECNTCFHIVIRKQTELYRILGTKYIQSDASKVYPEVKSCLKERKKVLFCGTPCQVAGLYSFLGSLKHDDNLLTVELICHGVPSKVTTDISCRYYNAKNIVSYRDKVTGWHKGFDCTYRMEDGKLLRNNGDAFFFKYFGGTDRPSCYQCKYARIERVADISLGDQWGLRDKYPERFDLGANLVLCHTDKAIQALTHGNIHFIQEQNSILNAPTLFMPVETGASSINRKLHIIKRLPPYLCFPLISMDWRKGWYLLPWIVWRKVVLYRYKRKFGKILMLTRKKYNWV